jgi:N-acetylneuraminic acid mutarotase
VPQTNIVGFEFTFGFTIGNKGYFNQRVWVRGVYQNLHFYEYDFITNTWEQKAVFPGNATQGQSSFTIGNKGYVAGGYSTNPSPNVPTPWKQTWAYNPQNDAWEQKQDLPGIEGNGYGRGYATGFSIGSKGYIVNGEYRVLNNLNNPVTVWLKSLLQYDPITDDWSYKTAFPGQKRCVTNVFVTSGVAYAGGGYGAFINYNDYYKYNPVTDAWTPIASHPLFLISNIGILGQANPSTFSINGKGYFISNKEGVIYKYIPQSCTGVSPL